MDKRKANRIALKKIIKLIECEKCGATEKLIRHHSDYSKPESVNILCRKCHSQWHTENESINGEGKEHIYIRVDATTKSLVNLALKKINKNNPDLKITAQEIGKKFFKEWARNINNI